MKHQINLRRFFLLFTLTTCLSLLTSIKLDKKISKPVDQRQLKKPVELYAAIKIKRESKL